MKKQISLFAAITTIAIANKEGYTVNVKTLQPETTGYAVSLKATQNSFGAEGLANVIRYVEEHSDVDAYGGWYDSKTGLYYYDATIIVDSLDQAYDLAKANEQIAFFDLTNGREIRL